MCNVTCQYSEIKLQEQELANGESRAAQCSTDSEHVHHKIIIVHVQSTYAIPDKTIITKINTILELLLNLKSQAGWSICSHADISQFANLSGLPYK